MSQQINLINPSLIHKKDFLRAANMTIVYGCLIALLTIVYALYLPRINAMAEQRDAVTRKQQEMQYTLDKALAATIPKPADQALQQEIAQLEAKRQMQVQLIQTIEHDQTTSTHGVATYLRGFARQTMPGVWLTGFDINKDLDAITIHGRCLQAELLPTYMEKLGKEPAFAGQSFSGLQMRQPATATKTAVSLTPNTQPVPSTQPVMETLDFVEFELQGRENQS